MKQSSEFKVDQKYKKPQINTDERRYFPVKDFSKIIHRKGREERKAMQQESLRPLRSLRLNVFFTPAHERRGSLHGMSAFIVHQRRRTGG